MLGAVKGIDPETGHYYDDTKRYIDGSSLSAADKQKIFEGNIRRVFPRMGPVPISWSWGLGDLNGSMQHHPASSMERWHRWEEHCSGSLSSGVSCGSAGSAAKES
jgi:hypothetical protein